jgi:hypothetical protein
MNKPHHTQGSSYPIDNSSKPRISTGDKHLNSLLFVAHSIYYDSTFSSATLFACFSNAGGVFFFPILVGQNLSFNKRKRELVLQNCSKLTLNMDCISFKSFFSPS